MLAVRNLQKRFGDVAALSGVSFELSRGELALLLGPNGAGKSTLLGCLAGVLNPDHGQILFDGKSRRASGLRVSYLGSRLMLYRNLSLRENLSFFARLSQLDQPEQAVELALSRFELGEFSDRLLSECSSGVQQRGALARAALGAPDLLLLDEPLSHLDATSAELARLRFQELAAGGCTLLISTHSADDIAVLGKRSVELSAGRIDEND